MSVIQVFVKGSPRCMVNFVVARVLVIVFAMVGVVDSLPWLLTMTRGCGLGRRVSVLCGTERMLTSIVWLNWFVVLVTSAFSMVRQGR